LALQAGDDVDLVLGQNLGDDLLGADLGGDPPGDGLVVASEQDRGAAETPQAGDGLSAGGLDGVGDGEDPACRSVRTNGEYSPALVLGCGHGGGDIGGKVLRPVGQQGLPADEHAAAVDDSLDALALDVRKVLGRGQRPDLLDCSLGDGLGDRVLGGVLQRACQAQQLGAVDAGLGDRLDQGHFAGGDGAGLVQHHSVDLAGGFEDLGAFDEHAHLRAAAGAD